MAVDTWCNIFTEAGIQKTFRDQPEIWDVVRWWGMESRIVGRDVDAFVRYMDTSGVETVLVPSAKMRSYKTEQLIWSVSEEEVQELADRAPGRVFGLVGIDPREGLRGVQRLEHWIRNGSFVGGHLHPYGFGLEVNHRRFYPFYAKLAELGAPLVVQIGHSAEAMPSAAGRPILLDDVALDLPELPIVAAHTGWPWIDEMIALAWKHRNVFIGTSAHHPKYWDPKLVAFATSRGRGKVLFGTDWPVMDHGDAITTIKGMQMKDETRDLLLSGTARRIFKLDERSAIGSTAMAAAR